MGGSGRAGICDGAGRTVHNACFLELFLAVKNVMHPQIDADMSGACIDSRCRPEGEPGF